MAMTVPSGGGAELEVMTEINTTPLIDVMLVLLIMLILTIPIQTDAIKMNMPVGAPPTQIKPPDAVQIDLAADGTVSWNGLALPDRAALEAKLAEIAAQPEQSELRLRPDQQVPYRAVAEVMASAQRLGATKIGLVGNERFM